jgi:hypothetical protein
MNLSWKQISGRIIIAAVILLLSIYVVKTIHGCKGKWYNVNYVLVAYIAVITTALLQYVDVITGLNLQYHLSKDGWMENYYYANQSGMGAVRKSSK